MVQKKAVGVWQFVDQLNSFCKVFPDKLAACCFQHKYTLANYPEFLPERGLKTIYATKRDEHVPVFVDARDYPFVKLFRWRCIAGTGSSSANNYFYIITGRGKRLTHTLLGDCVGRISHRNGNTMDCRRCNLIGEANRSEAEVVLHQLQDGKWRLDAPESASEMTFLLFEGRSAAHQARAAKRYIEAYRQQRIYPVYKPLNFESELEPEMSL